AVWPRSRRCRRTSPLASICRGRRRPRDRTLAVASTKTESGGRADTFASRRIRRAASSPPFLAPRRASARRKRQTRDNDRESTSAGNDRPIVEIEDDVFGILALLVLVGKRRAGEVLCRHESKAQGAHILAMRKLTLVEHLAPGEDGVAREHGINVAAAI